MRTRCVLFMLLCVALTLVVAFPASASQLPEQRIFDEAGFLTSGEEANLGVLAVEKASECGCPIYVATYRVPSGGSSYQYRYEGEDFLDDHGLSMQEDLILLVVTLDRGTYYYDLYLYGDAWDRINSKEVDYILDHDDVYDNLKGGLLEDGLVAFLELSAQGYAGRVGASYGVIVTVALIISLLISFFVCLGVYRSYKAKKKSVDYPLDQFAKLKLTQQSDVFTGSFVTRRVIQSSSGGGRGGSSHGGGGGHAGGR